MSCYLGVLSGTSADGIDAAAVEFDTGPPRLLRYHSTALEAGLRLRLLELGQGAEPGLEELGRLHIRLGQAFGHAARALMHSLGLAPSQVAALGLHGQTLLHRPDAGQGFTLQLGDPNSVTALTGVTTVSDFRGMDMAWGGQGAPLAPAFHAAMFQQPGTTRALVNIGGIANLSVLPAGPAAAVRGFDTGPGNALLDAWTARHLGQDYDRDGAWASGGRLHTALLSALLEDAYFALPAPKSTGRDYFHLDWLQRVLDRMARPPGARDVQRTLVALTAESIARALEHEAPDTAALYVCGGGAFNPLLLDALRARLAPRQVEPSDALGLRPDAVEAVMFAWLARERLAGRCVDLRAVSGAARPVCLGAVYSPPAPGLRRD